MANYIYTTLTVEGPQKSVDAFIAERNVEEFRPVDPEPKGSDPAAGVRAIETVFETRNVPPVDDLFAVALTYPDCAFRGSWREETYEWKGGVFAFETGTDRTALALSYTIEDLRNALNRAQDTFARLDGPNPVDALRDALKQALDRFAGLDGPSRIGAMCRFQTDEEYRADRKAFLEAMGCEEWDPSVSPLPELSADPF